MLPVYATFCIQAVSCVEVTFHQNLQSDVFSNLRLVQSRKKVCLDPLVRVHFVLVSKQTRKFETFEAGIFSFFGKNC